MNGEQKKILIIGMAIGAFVSIFYHSVFGHSAMCVIMGVLSAFGAILYLDRNN
jgi:uncharacterized membrane protein YoaK (UPF0700 family)